MSIDNGVGTPSWLRVPTWGAATTAVVLPSRVLAAALVAIVVLAWIAGCLPAYADRSLTWTPFARASLQEMLLRTMLVVVLIIAMVGAYSLAH